MHRRRAPQLRMDATCLGIMGDLQSERQGSTIEMRWGISVARRHHLQNSCLKLQQLVWMKGLGPSVMSTDLKILEDYQIGAVM